MILDKYIPFKIKVLISVISAGFWIYFRTARCYEMIPPNKIFPVIFVMGWAYLNYYEPLFLPLGLLVLILFTVIKHDKFAFFDTEKIEM